MAEGKRIGIIQVEELEISGKKYLSVVVQDQFKKYKIEVSDRYCIRLRKWLIKENKLANIELLDDRSSYDCLITGGKIRVPSRKMDVLEIITDQKITPKELNQSIEIYIEPFTYQKAASCYNFAAGGDRYDFSLSYDGKLDTNHVTYKINGADQGIFSQKAGEELGEFFTFDEKHPGGVWKTFKEEDIKLYMIAADNNRVFCYGRNPKNTGKKNYFFWAALVDEFPSEPSGALPALYVRDQTTDGERKKRYEEVEKLFESKGKHPALVMQLYGNKLDAFIAGGTKISNMFKEKGKQAKLAMPIVVKPGKWYEVGLDTAMIDSVIDIGIANPHRYEHYKKDIGGEIQAFIFDQKLEEYNHKRINLLDIMSFFNPASLLTGQLIDHAMRTTFPNLKVHDGMGYNDGTCNLFVLAKLKQGIGDDLQTRGILWCDEQENFSEKWRLLSPSNKDYNGAIGNLSVFSAIEWFHNGAQLATDGITPETYLQPKNKNIKAFEALFRASEPYKVVNDWCNIAVSGSIITLSTNDAIYTITCMWGVTDFRWNKREYPDKKVIFPGTIKIRPDTTITLCATDDTNGNPEFGYCYQRYLPQSIYQEDYGRKEYSAKNFKGELGHEWSFVTEKVFTIMNKYYQFGIYDAYSEKHPTPDGYKPFQNGRTNYKQRGVDERCQYYKVLLDPADQLEEVKSLVTQNPSLRWFPDKREVHNPFFSDYKLKKNIGINIRYDQVIKAFVAVYLNPCDDDIVFDMENSGYLTEYTPFDHDLTGSWTPSSEQGNKQREISILLGAVYFSPESEEYREEAQREKLRLIVERINKNYPNNAVYFHGHVADLPNPDKEWAKKLSGNRAEKVRKDVIAMIEGMKKKLNRQAIFKPTNYQTIAESNTKPVKGKDKNESRLLSRRVEIRVKIALNGYNFRFKDRKRDYSPPSVKEATLKQNGKKVTVTFKTNDSSIRYITVGAIVNNEARPISKRYVIDTEIVKANLFLLEKKKEQFKLKAESLFDTKNLKDINGKEMLKKVLNSLSLIKKSIDRVVTAQDLTTIGEKLSKIELGSQVIAAAEEFKNKFLSEHKLPAMETITVEIDLHDFGQNEAFFQSDSHRYHGTSVWFEDMLGHKCTPQILKIG